MKLWFMIKCRTHKDVDGTLWLLEDINYLDSYEFSYRLVTRKFFFFYELGNEWVTTSLFKEPNL